MSPKKGFTQEQIAPAACLADVGKRADEACRLSSLRQIACVVRMVERSGTRREAIAGMLRSRHSD